VTLAALTMSHSPLMDLVEPRSGARERVEAAFATAREFIAEVAPDLVVLFAPDHYNGFFYDLMPGFCIGRGAISIGDYGTMPGELLVDRGAAGLLTRAVLDAGVDVAVSERMYVDHGFAQPLQVLFGGIDRIPVVPVFINCVAEPLGPVRRARLLGQAVGRALTGLGRRTLVVGSGGLSHDPPLPRLEDATAEVAATLISGGRTLTPEQRAAREQRVIDAGRRYAAASRASTAQAHATQPSTMRPLNPDWDRRLLAVLAGNRLEELDSWTTDSFTAAAGHSSHESRTSIAAYAALAAQGPYEVRSSFYEPIPDWIAGFAVTTAAPRQGVSA
jgi:2,3-dihydroxyphenylpropionate 1,2-dioxygenase